MSKIDFKNALYFFNEHVSLQKQMINLDKEETENRIYWMDKKIIHTMEVIKDGTKVVKELGLNDSVLQFCKLSFLNHDIGRFTQMRLIGNYKDSELKEKFLSINDHGQLGKNILKAGLIRKQIPLTRVFDESIFTIVNDHVNKRLNDSQLKILGLDCLKNEEIYDIFNSKDKKLKSDITASITQIVQDVDRLDIFHQILDGRWNPLTTNLEIDEKVFEMFYKGQYLDMNDLKQKGLWNANVGELVRLSFIYQIRLLSVAKVILSENIILQLKEKRNNDKLKDAFDYTNDLLKEMINKSEDEIIVPKIKTLTQK